MKKLAIDLIVRFIFGGLAVAICYIFLIMIPWKSFAGIFAAFPAVMISAVILAGVEKGSRTAADIAFGAVAGMIGGLVCVTTTLVALNTSHEVVWSIFIGLISWFISSAITFKIMKKIKYRPITSKAND
ncbi:hypothetical protein Desca_1394 [Desulfotomaculum nigrificans CO-1-SRB]|uniref:DUF3147 family protein n=1 Tax=Desulfotomaculum nigrificans (strain DSM 14880 / VKM B-2319 / CO-1-SRB) TaxID=868595 RepID=F6B5D0_DESCC|nr:DUF3147 family protein [Desulfotomaculum nigrificans]AEF94251.1 hypothetical protein Desca_1394 [Desulfotomaculum nigrificans CO-1-SRB]